MANDGQTDSEVATVVISSAVVNTAPIVSDDTFDVTEDLSLSISIANLLENDNDNEGDALLLSVVDQPTNGSLIVDQLTILYSPNAILMAATCSPIELTMENSIRNWRQWRLP